MPVKKKPGPKSLANNPHTWDRAYRLALIGLTDRELAIAFDVNVTTIDKWKKECPEFRNALEKGKTEADAEVVQSLFKRATGFSYEEEQIVIDKKGQYKRITRKVVPPDTTACIFWLKNRQRDKWADVHKFESTGDITINFLQQNNINLDHFTIEELKVMEKLGLKKLLESGTKNN